MSDYPSPNFGERRGGVRPSIIVIHYTAMASCVEARDRLCDPAVEVSAHWLIGCDGATQQLVDEAARAWHAGAGTWAGLDDINSHSIGIELDNPGDQPFSNPQMQALETLLPQIMARWGILPHGVIAHSDMAPDRKRDPGPRFDWRRLAMKGLSVWPESAAPETDSPDEAPDFVTSLRRFGYPDFAPDILLGSFRMRFRPWAIGPKDATDRSLAANLAARFPALPNQA